MTRVQARTFALAFALGLGGVHSGARAAAACPLAADIGQKELLGTWRAEIEGDAKPATLRLVKHPRYAETVRGVLERGGRRTQVSGDVDNGDLTLEESVNGTNISATWLGEVVEGSCGREIRGTWQAEGDTASRAFVLRKQR